MPIRDAYDDDWRGGGNGGGIGAGLLVSGPKGYETATLQLLLGEGRIEGLVDGLKSIYLDGTPILNSDGSKNFKGVALALVAGTNTQAAVKGIGGVESEVSVNVQVTNSASVTRSITSNPSAIRVRIALPALKIVRTDGGSVGTAVTIKIERQNAAYNGGAWEVVPLEEGGVIGGGPYSSKFTRSFRVDLPAAGTWQVRVTRMSADDADAYHASQTWWEAYTEVIDARLRYPNSAVLSLRVNAQQFRSIPRVACDLKLARIQVPANYNPLTRAYATTGLGTTGGAWDGTFKEAWTDNPAWIFFDAATKTRYGAGSFLTASALDKWTLYTIGQWCDTLVDDGKGGTEPRITCNLYMQNQQNAIKALGQLASIFWGVIYYASGLVVPVADANTAPVAVFNSSNVIEGKFTYEGTARSARHTAAVVKFTNPDLGWEPDTAVYEDADGIARFGYNPLDLTALGCTSHGQALRLAKWSILTELLADETITFSSGLEGSTVKPGDVVQVHDQFRAGNVRFGGRVASGATTTVIPLDAPVTFGAGTHYLKIKNASGVLETRTVTTAAGTVSSLTVSSGFSVAPAAGAVWLLQAGTEASLWRALAIRKGEGITYDITALKHDPAKYVLLGLSAGEVLPRDVDPRTSPAPAGLAVTATTRILNDRQVQNLEANWTLDGALSYTAVASKDYGPWVTMAVSGATAILSGIDPGSWRVRVVGSWPAGNSPFAEATAVVTAPATQPPWVAGATSAAATAQSAATAAAQAAAYADMLARSPHNLIKNGNSEDPNPTGMEAAGVVTDGSPLSGTKIRRLDSGGGGLYFANIGVTPGEQFLFSLWIWNANIENASAYLYILFLDASGSVIWAGSPSLHTGALSGGGYVQRSVSGTAPAGAVTAKFHINADAGNGWFRIDGLYACRKISAGMLEADLAILGVIRSPNYVAGSYGNAPQGFKLSGYAFTTTFKDGSTSSNCYQEIGGDANFGGEKVQTIVNRAMGGKVEFTSGSGTWTVPVGITSIKVTMADGGQGGQGGGAGSTATNEAGSAGVGGAQGAASERRLAVTPGQTVSWAVGSGGAGGAGGSTEGAGGGPGSPGGASTVTVGGVTYSSAYATVMTYAYPGVWTFPAPGGRGSSGANGAQSVPGPGGAGGWDSILGDGGNGGYGAPVPYGENAAPGVNAAANTGAGGGGGGAGGVHLGTTWKPGANGGNGGSGKIIIEWGV